MARMVSILDATGWFAHYKDHPKYDFLPIVAFLWHGDTNLNKGEFGNITGLTLVDDDIIDASKVPNFHGFSREYNTDSIGVVSEQQIKDALSTQVTLKDREIEQLAQSRLITKLVDLIVYRRYRKVIEDQLHPHVGDF